MDDVGVKAEFQKAFTDLLEGPTQAVKAWGGSLVNSPAGVSVTRRLTNMAPNHHTLGYMFPVACPLGGADFPSAGRSIDGFVHWNSEGPKA